MRVRITQELRGSIDGIPLGRLMKGCVYDINTPLACYLLSEEVAELALDAEPVAALPIERRMVVRFEASSMGIVVLPRAVAADRPPRKRRKDR